MTARTNLHSVPQPPADQPEPSYAYEHEQRQASARRDWAALHIAGDRRPALGFLDRVRRTWR